MDLTLLNSVIRKRLARAGLALLSAILTPVAARAAEGWYSSWDSASEMARSCRQPLVVLFEHEGCPDCERMSEALAARASRNALDCAVKVRLEFTHHPELTARYGVSLTPTFLVLQPEGKAMKEVYREVGSMSVSRIVQVGGSISNLAARMTAEQPAPKEEKPSGNTELASADPTASQKKNPAKKQSSRRLKRRAQNAEPQENRPAEQPTVQGYSYTDPYGQQSAYQQPQPQPQRPQRRGFWPFW